MGKSTNFSGQPIFNHLLKFIDKNEISKVAKHYEKELYAHEFITYHPIVVMHFGALSFINPLGKQYWDFWGMYLNCPIQDSFNWFAGARSLEVNGRRSNNPRGDIYMCTHR